MIDRVTFIHSISGIAYPEMLVHFFDQFIALKKLVEDTGEITVESNTENSITFIISFKNNNIKNKALMNVQVGSVIIYGRPINVSIQNISDTELRFKLQ